MPRKVKGNNSQMEDNIIACYIDDHGREVTTIEERRAIAQRWCDGDYEHHRAFAIKKKLLPIALLIASLIEIDHPILVSPSRGVMYSPIDCALILMEVMLKEHAVATPVNSFHKQPVERI